MTDEDSKAWEDYANAHYWNRNDPGKDHSREQAAKGLWIECCAYKDKRITELEELVIEAGEIMKFTGWIGTTTERARIDAFISYCHNGPPVSIQEGGGYD